MEFPSTFVCWVTIHICTLISKWKNPTPLVLDGGILEKKNISILRLSFIYKPKKGAPSSRIFEKRKIFNFFSIFEIFFFIFFSSSVSLIKLFNFEKSLKRLHQTRNSSGISDLRKSQQFKTSKKVFFFCSSVCFESTFSLNWFKSAFWFFSQLIRLLQILIWLFFEIFQIRQIWIEKQLI